MNDRGRARRAAWGIVLVALWACASDPPLRVQVEPLAPAPSSVWIRDVAVLDVATGKRDVARDVVLEAGRIAAIEPAGSAEPPPGAHVVSGIGATLVPGLVDVHGHLNVDPRPTWAGFAPDVDANLRSYLYAGVTTVLDPGDASGDAFERRERVARGEQTGPQIFTAGPILTAPDGHPISIARIFAPWWIEWYVAGLVAVPVGSPEEGREAVDALVREGPPDVVKIVVDHIPLDSARMEPEVMAAIVDQARGHGLRVVAHIGSTQDAIDAAEAGVAAWMHGVYIERIPDEAIAVLASYGIPMVATIEVFDRYARAGRPRESTALERETASAAVLDSFYPPPEGFGGGPLASWVAANQAAAEARFDNVRRLHEAGVTILAGSDAQSGVFPGPGLHRELAQLVRAGLTPLEALRAATLDAARFLADGEEPDFGSIEVGKRADLLLVEGDPRADVAALARIRTVFQGGLPLDRVPIPWTESVQAEGAQRGAAERSRTDGDHARKVAGPLPETPGGL